MASPAAALRVAMSELSKDEEIDEDDLEDEPLVEQLVDLYGSNEAVASAAGLPTSAEAVAEWRARHPKAPKGSANARKIGQAARRDRQSFLRNLQRYEAGTRRPRATTARLERLRTSKLEERLAASTLAGLAQVFRDDGVTVRVRELTMSYDGRIREHLPLVTFGGRARVPLPSEFVAAVRRGAWGEASGIFWACHGEAYGAYMDPEDVDGLELEIGNNPAAYGYSRAA